MTWAMLAALLAVPFVVLVATSFLKFSVVLEVLRRGFGAAVPSGAVAAALSLLLTALVMEPVAEQVFREVAKVATRGDAGAVIEAGARASEPVRAFLMAHTKVDERAAFVEVTRKLRTGAAAQAVTERDLLVLMTAFAAAELKAAFLLGFLVLLPFLVIDLLVGATLAQVGMTQVQPELMALPFKLLLFSIADGWSLLFRGLVLSYT